MQALAKESWKDEMFGDEISSEDEFLPGTDALIAAPFEMKMIPEVGGGRGLFATTFIRAGSLVVAEVPVQMWSLDKNSLGDKEKLFATVRGVLTSRDAHSSTINLHPIALSEVSQEELDKIRELWTEDALTSILVEAEEAQMETDVDEILRVSLVLQHNGFSSGLYQLLCLINHSCEPNCVKFSPVRPKGWQCASEIWSTRDILTGEELTICYCNSPEMTCTSRQEYLTSHHGFRCRCPRCVLSEQDEDNSSASYAMEISIDKLTSAIESACTSSPQETQDIAATTRSAKQAAIRHLVEKVTPLFEECKASLLALLKHHWSVVADMATDSSSGKIPWTDELSLLVKLLKHVVRLCASRVNLMQVLFPVSPGSVLNRRKPAAVVNESQAAISSVHTKLLQGVMEYVLYATTLRHVQESYLSPVHVDFAQTYFDLTESSSFLLSLLHRLTQDEEDNLLVNVQLGDVAESILNHYVSVREWIGSAPKCIVHLEEARLTYHKLETMYKSTFLGLKNVLESSRIAACATFISGNK